MNCHLEKHIVFPIKYQGYFTETWATIISETTLKNMGKCITVIQKMLYPVVRPEVIFAKKIIINATYFLWG